MAPSTKMLDSCVAGWRARVAAKERAATERRERLRAILPALVACLVDEFGATRVVLFGSMARGDVHGESDIDLLVSGLAPSKLFHATAATERIARHARIDLVPDALVRREVLDRIAVEGIVLHG